MATAELRIETLLEDVIRKHASDLHLQVGLPPMLRIDGSLAPVAGAKVLSEEDVERLIFAILDQDQQQILMKDKEFDFSFAFGDLGRFRVNAFHERGNLAAALRLIPNEIKTIAELGMPNVVNDFANYPRGLVLVTGPTGSGKSTTLAALLDKVNSEKSHHIITIEDPIEFTHKSKKSVIVQREVHYDTYSFSSALRSSLRQDPDVVLIGEMRDLETISAAITIAETGHLVFATLHTNDAAQAIDRIIDVFPAWRQEQTRVQLAASLSAIVAQRLVPKVGGGMVAAFEVLIATSPVRNLIREGRSNQLTNVMFTNTKEGMQILEADLARLVVAGTVSYEDAFATSAHPKELTRSLEFLGYKGTKA